MNKCLTINIKYIFFIICIFLSFSVYTQDKYSSKISRIEEFINENYIKGKLPGLSVVITEGDQTIYTNFIGYSNIKSSKVITNDSLFELGSTSKAFTALGILLLQEQSKLKIDDNVSKYIEGFYLMNNGEKVDIKIKHLLYHTSGIPFKSICYIPITDSSNSIEITVNNIVGMQVENLPGKEYIYATINYDVLGLIIEKVTNQTYEDFILNNIFKPLGLNNTFSNRKKSYEDNNMTTGYKMNFLSAEEFDAPSYRGNTPAGYIVSNSKDVARWLKIQSGSIDIEPLFSKLIKGSHLKDNTVEPHYDGSSYAGGWKIYQKGTGELSHGGNNPNFSSFFIVRPEDKLGVAVLTNINSEYTGYISQGIMNILIDEKVEGIQKDIYMNIDRMSVGLLVISIIIITFLIYFGVFLFKDFIKGERKLKSFEAKNVIFIFFSFIFIIYLIYCLYLIPDVLFNEVSWEFTKVWAPSTLLLSLKFLTATIVLLCIYFQAIFYFPKKEENTIFPLVVLSLVSGFGNSFIIFTINESLNDIFNLNLALVTYFLFGILMYIIGQKLIRNKMVKLTNDVIYEKRIRLISKVLGSNYTTIENIEKGKIHASLNNDTEQVSRAPDLIVGCLTSIITLICCFVYLGVINIFGLIISIITILIAASLYVIVGNAANKLWEDCRNIQNTFFSFINDLIGGFKELILSSSKNNDFFQDIKKSCSEYRNKNILATTKFTNVVVIGELLFTLVIGVVAFIFPLVLKNLESFTLRTYIFVFLYMTGPVNGVLSSIPQLFQINISWKRIKDFTEEIDSLICEDVEYKKDINAYEDMGNISLLLKDVEYTYKNKLKKFHVGPINFEFKAGEIIFITGGNGSGKTTLARLITGLYKQDKGKVFFNYQNIDHKHLGEYYSHIFSDFYLFKKMYGIDYSLKGKEISELLSLFKIKDKLDIENGEFSTLELSDGQRKRVALLQSYLEDKQIYLFDEWAADQDPEFRRFFYEKIIFDLKKRNKCVIAITHDDHYFHHADKIIKLNLGKIEKITDNCKYKLANNIKNI